jgi:hypothetical protein
MLGFECRAEDSDSDCCTLIEGARISDLRIPSCVSSVSFLSRYHLDRVNKIDIFRPWSIVVNSYLSTIVNKCSMKTYVVHTCHQAIIM